jgi:cytochrome P450
MAEMQRSQVTSHAEDALPKFDPSLLAKQPLLQSVFSEVLRHEVTIMLARSVDEDHDVGNYRIPKDSAVLISTHVEHMDRTRWETTRGGEFHPVEEFWPERFLDYNTDDGEPIFSLKGLEGTFIPFGIGHYMCPGRHFSTRAILSIASLLMSGFDIELRDANRWVDSTRDYRSFGYSTLRPGKKTPFRIRRKVVSKEGAV